MVWGSPLHYCIYSSRGDADVLVDLFLEYGADPNGLGPAGLGGYYGTPLNAAAARNEPELMEILLDKGADPNIRGNRQGWTALQLACLYNRREPFNILLEHDPDVNAHGPYGTPLQAAAYSGAKPLVRKLLRRGADLTVCGQGRYGHSLQSAAMRAREGVVRFLIKHGADVRVKGGRFGTVLQAASIRCSKALVDFLLRKGCPIDERGGRYKTALQAACAARNRPVVMTLLEHKANVNIAGGRFGSALQAACVAGDLDIVRMLVERGADIDGGTGYYGSPVDAAACHGNVSILRYLIKEAGATQTTVNRRSDRLNSQRFDWADRNIAEALKDEKSEAKPSARALDGHGEGEGGEDETPDVEDPPMNVDSIPMYDPRVPASSDSGSSTAFSTLESSTSASDYSDPTNPEPAVPLGKKARRRLARKESNKTWVVEEVKEMEPEAQEEDLSALSWLQVECGYGGDLNGPGR